MAETDKIPVINAVGLSKVFRDFWNRSKARAVNDIDFQVFPGEVVGLLGPNGSGKSTTVKMLLGLLYPTAGNLTIFGQSPRDVRTKDRIGYLPEESYLYKYLTAEETLDFFAALFDLPAAERRRRIEQLLEMVGLAHARRRTVGEFSKGMQRRIGLAQAMVNDPSLLILDEPTSGLDPLGCREVKDLILLLKKRGKTVLVTSHLLSDVEDICDRVIILYGGKIRATGTLDKLLTLPETSRISMPMLKGEELNRVLGVLRKELKNESFTVDHPRMSLEDFFLQVINRARAESVETAGVVSGGHVAEYLTEGVVETDPKQVLNALLKEEKEPEPPPATAAVEEEKPEVKAEVLEGLTEEEQEEEVRPAVPEPKEDLSEVNQKLKDLL
ncbi:MAG: ABC transporter ATP-binding protein [Victivallales bacterium]|nr:ABC transporter ATP-binding protein [Victivallales bacterium]